MPVCNVMPTEKPKSQHDLCAGMVTRKANSRVLETGFLVWQPATAPSDGGRSTAAANQKSGQLFQSARAGAEGNQSFTGGINQSIGLPPRLCDSEQCRISRLF